MKKTKLKILFTSLGFFALSTTFAQVDTSGSHMGTTGDSLNRSVPQGSPVATDSSSTNMNSTQSSSSTNSGSTNSSTQSWNSDSTSASGAAGYNKADKKRMKADKKEAKAIKKESNQ
jgi:hypothetical protein